MNTRKNTPEFVRESPLPNPKNKVLPGKYTVGRILDCRHLEPLAPKEYLIAWESYSLTESTWEPAHHIPDSLIRYSHIVFVVLHVTFLAC